MKGDMNMDKKTRVRKGIAGILSLGRKTKAARETVAAQKEDGQWYYCESCSSNSGVSTNTWHTVSEEGIYDMLRCSVCGNIKQVTVR